MITVRLLNFKQPEDLAQFKTLYASWLQIYGVTLTDQRFWGFIAFYKYESKFVGAFEDNHLVAVMRYYRSNMVPYYYLNSLILDQDKYTYSDYSPDHPFVKILDNILETMELEGRYTWFQSYFLHEDHKENPNDLIKHCSRGWDDEKQQVIELITNQFTWSPNTISELYKSRWQIEIFFREIKQLLHIKTFIGTSENAVMTQIWTALITILILKALKAQSKFGWHLSNLVAFIRLNLFVKIELKKWLDKPF